MKLLYTRSGVPGCEWGLIVLRLPTEFLVMTHRGLHSASKNSVVVGPGHPDYERADEVWQTAFAALRLASLPNTAVRSSDPEPAMPASRRRPPPLSRELRLAAMRRALRNVSLTRAELAEKLSISPTYVRSLFTTLVRTGEARQVGDQCALVPSHKRDAEHSVNLVREALKKGPHTFAELFRATGLSQAYCRRLAIRLLKSGEARQQERGHIELVVKGAG